MVAKHRERNVMFDTDVLSFLRDDLKDLEIGRGGVDDAGLTKDGRTEIETATVGHVDLDDGNCRLCDDRDVLAMDDLDLRDDPALETEDNVGAVVDEDVVDL